ncbi:MAG: bifunctional DNA-formamidopyrimidine glycosylase/DNA-(apurinic or apyrimidinic site) lyase [Pelistega sp.]|nr:bifunctional DNA-formamidopyrimidine glycosylase/DNA-(apurinic or apyrimidinic site) lyase [Pelistega sp.]
MPELPEVETTRRGLEPFVAGQAVKAFRIYFPTLRWPIPAFLPETLKGQQVLSITRRGKYILMNFSHGSLLIHLGMSGSIRRVNEGEFLLKHDHIEWVFDKACFRLNDPRRFGAILWHEGDNVLEHPLLQSLGIEPFDPLFTVDYLYQALRQKSQNIKASLLSGSIVVGVGNIYCSESLFKAGINPKVASNKISHQRVERLHQAILDTLNKALESGGSTLKDFHHTDGQPGAYFELHAQVYDRLGQACRVCATPIKKIIQGQRATYYCPRCQSR